MKNPEVLAMVELYSERWEKETFYQCAPPNDTNESEWIKYALTEYLNRELIDFVDGEMDYEDRDSLRKYFNGITRRETERFLKKLWPSFEAQILPLLASNDTYTHRLKKAKTDSYNHYIPHPNSRRRVPVKITADILKSDRGEDLQYLLFAPGIYWIDINPFPFELWSSCMDEMVKQCKPKGGASVRRRPKVRAKDYALAYIIESDISGTNLPSTKSDIEASGKEYTEGSGLSGNTFYKAFNDAKYIDRNDSKKLAEKFGKDWKDKILAAARQPDQIKEYLSEKNM